MTWLLALLTAIGKALGLLQSHQEQQADKAVTKAGETAQKAAQQEQVIHEVQAAERVRADAVAERVLHPERLRDDDGFKRPN